MNKNDKACIYWHDGDGHWAQFCTTRQDVRLIAAYYAVEMVTRHSDNSRWPAFGDLGEDYLLVMPDDIALFERLRLIGETTDAIRGYEGYHEGEVLTLRGTPGGYRPPTGHMDSESSGFIAPDLGLS